MQAHTKTEAIALTAIIASLAIFIALSTYSPGGEKISIINSTNNGFHERDPGIPIKYTYGLKAELVPAATQWSIDRGTPLLQPTWLPDGMKRTAVYVQHSNVTTQTGVITMVTTLYSFKGLDDPGTAEVLLGVQMYWNMPWMVPHPGVKIGVEGNYTMINGNPGYVGVIGWYYGSYPDLYGEGARVVVVQVGDVLYFFRAPMSFSSSDLMKMATSLKPVSSDPNDLTFTLGVPTRNDTLLIRRVQFEEVDQIFSPDLIGVSPLFDNSSRGLTLSLPPDSFVVNKTWSSVDNYVKHEVSLVTWLRKGEIVSFSFNATKEISFDLGLWDGGSYVSVGDVASYGQTYRVPKTGVYVFGFAVPNTVQFSEYVSVSFRCYWVVQNVSVDESSIKPDITTNAGKLNSTGEVPATLATVFASSVGTLPDPANPHLEPPTETIMLTLLVISVILLVLGRNVASAGREDA